MNFVLCVEELSSATRSARRNAGQKNELGPKQRCPPDLHRCASPTQRYSASSFQLVLSSTGLTGPLFYALGSDMAGIQSRWALSPRQVGESRGKS